MTYAFCFPKKFPQFNNQPTQTRVLSRNVRNFLDNELSLNLKQKHFLLAVSGGVDSLALLCLWLWLRPIYHHSISVCHVDHMLRPESALEAKTIAALCDAWGIECFLTQIDVTATAKLQKKGLEETARHMRYTQLEHFRHKCKADYICLGHHLNDLQEDVLMRLMRGSNWPALGGMVAIDENRHILRPLLMENKATLHALLEHAGIGFAHDKSNDERTYLRNRVRHDLLPLMHAENPAFEQKIKEMWMFARYDAQHWQDVVQKLFMQYAVFVHNDSVTLPAQLLKSIDKATRLRLYMHCMRTLLEHLTDMRMAQARAMTLLELDDAFLHGRGNKIFKFPGCLEAKLKQGNITIYVVHANTAI